MNLLTLSNALDQKLHVGRQIVGTLLATRRGDAFLLPIVGHSKMAIFKRVAVSPSVLCGLSWAPRAPERAAAQCPVETSTSGDHEDRG